MARHGPPPLSPLTPGGCGPKPRSVSHVTLLGDSIFDNSRYVPGGSPVVDQLHRLPRGWRATLLAVDGAVAADVPSQLARLPADATHLVVSAGGNDALGAGGCSTSPDCRRPGRSPHWPTPRGGS